MIVKNRDRETPTFANINLLGKCNADCFFCLGKDIEEELSKHDQTKIHFSEWKNFQDFVLLCEGNGIKKIYITGQNVDSLQYSYLQELIDYLQACAFQVGLRTNGVLALQKMDTINSCDLSIGYSIHTLESDILPSIWGKTPMPDWEQIIPKTTNPRVAIVITEQTEDEFFDIVRYVSSFPNVRYIQARRISTETRYEELKPHIEAYERVFKRVQVWYPKIEPDFYLAQRFKIAFDKEVLFWRTVETSVNSFNYFTDGTVSDEYFIVEGYMNHKES